MHRYLFNAGAFVFFVFSAFNLPVVKSFFCAFSKVMLRGVLVTTISQASLVNRAGLANDRNGHTEGADWYAMAAARL